MRKYQNRGIKGKVTELRKYQNRPSIPAAWERRKYQNGGIMAKVTPFRDPGGARRPVGFVILDRKVFTNKLIENGPAEHFKWWAWLIVHANFAKGHGLDRGEIFVTVEDLQRVCTVEKTKGHAASVPSVESVRWFLKVCRGEKMISTRRGRHGTIVKILNYDRYQAKRSTDVPAENAPRNKTDLIPSNSGGLSVQETECTPELNIDAPRNKTYGNTLDSLEIKNPDRQCTPESNSGPASDPVLSGKNAGEMAIDAGLNPGNDCITGENKNAPRNKTGAKPAESLDNQNQKPECTPVSYNKQQRIKNLKTTNLEAGPVSSVPAVPGGGEILVPGSVVVSDIDGRLPAGYIPCDEILTLWLEICPALPKARMTKNLRARISARWKEEPDCRSLAWWRAYFTDVAASDFLSGDNVRGWTASIHWVTGPENMGKILAGNYINRPRRAPKPETYRQCQDLEQRLMAEECLRKINENKRKGKGILDA